MESKHYPVLGLSWGRAVGVVVDLAPQVLLLLLQLSHLTVQVGHHLVEQSRALELSDVSGGINKGKKCP